MSKKQKTDQSKWHNSSLASYIKSISGFEVLSIKKEQLIVKEILNGSEYSREKLVQGCLRLVIAIANRYTHLNVPIEDLVNDGNIGLIQAAEKFDPRKGYRFVTYAHHHINGAILKSIHLNSSLVRIPKYITQKKTRIDKKLQSNLFCEIKIDCEDLREHNNLLKWSYKSPKYIDLCNKTSNLASNDDKSIYNINPEIREEELKNLLSRAISILPENERNIILLYFGFNTEINTPTFQSISEEMGISKEGVRIIKIRALKKLKIFLKGIERDEFMEF